MCLWEQVRNYLPVILAPSLLTSWKIKENQEYEEIIFHIFLLWVLFGVLAERILVYLQLGKEDSLIEVPGLYINWWHFLFNFFLMIF